MSQIERMKQAAQRKPVGKPAAIAKPTSPKSSAPKPAKVKPPKKSPADRPEYAGLPNEPCPDCGFDHPKPVDKIHHDRLHCKKPWPTLPKGKHHKNDRRMAQKRLPDLSSFAFVYNAEIEKWAGSLMIPVPGAEPLLFQTTHTGVCTLPIKLDRIYREHLMAKFGPSKPEEKP